MAKAGCCASSVHVPTGKGYSLEIRKTPNKVFSITHQLERRKFRNPYGLVSTCHGALAQFFEAEPTSARSNRDVKLDVENTVQCVASECSRQCKELPEYRGGYCNHYQLCSCYRHRGCPEGDEERWEWGVEDIR
ncbi:hypothetical protein FOCC_FOCC005679 [Frankliniella occidentalis]|nr:hypothetical protein FOCC_FOCC005679 [Frankliniella occidentalis]